MNIKRLVLASFPVYIRINDKGATSGDGGAAPKIADGMMDLNLRKNGYQYVHRKVELLPEDFQLIQITIFFSDAGSWNEPVVLQSGVDFHSCIVDYTWAKRSKTVLTEFVDYFTIQKDNISRKHSPFIYLLDNYQRNLWLHNPFEAFWNFRDRKGRLTPIGSVEGRKFDPPIYPTK
jgi:hypothetical protein